MRALDDISFEIAEGETFALLGPNGAGKTTTLEIIEGIQRPTDGELSVMDVDVTRHRKRVAHLIGVQLQSSAFPERLQLHEILELYGAYYGLRVDADELLETVDLVEKRDEVLSRLSGGQSRRFSIAASIVNDPKILFLDEPTSGLDPHGRRVIWALIERLRTVGRTIVLSTHYLDEAQALCDRVGIIDRGRLVALDAPEDIVGTLHAAHRVTFTVERRGRALSGLLRAFADPGSVREERIGRFHRVELSTDRPHELLRELARAAPGTWASVADLRVEPPTLEDAFIAITGRRAAG